MHTLTYFGINPRINAHLSGALAFEPLHLKYIKVYNYITFLCHQLLNVF